MALKDPHKAGTPFTLCLILVLGIAFLAPLYHSHVHDADCHQGNSDDHVLLHAESAHESLSAGEQHNSSHLHITKDIARSVTYLHFKGRSLRASLCAVTTSPVLSGHLTRNRPKYTQAFVFRSNSHDCLSGLSPPAA